jgi:hypothetical protein
VTTILSPTDYPEIRDAVLIGLDPVDLPDATIGRDIYAGTAEQWAQTLVPGWSTLAGPEAAHLHRAAKLYCASLLCSAMNTITSRDDFRLSITVAKVDWQARAAILASRAEAEASLALDVVLVNIPGMFGLAHGYRGR